MIIFPNNRSFQRKMDGEAAAMSKVHFLVIPKRRVYNLVSLTKADLPLLKEMQERAKMVYESELVKEYYDSAGPQDHLIADFKSMREGKHPDSRFTEVGFLKFFLHPHPLHSVGQLHMHCCLFNPKMWSKRGNEFNEMTKNIPVNVVEEILDGDIFLKVLEASNDPRPDGL